MVWQECRKGRCNYLTRVCPQQNETQSRKVGAQLQIHVSGVNLLTLIGIAADLQ